MRDYMTGMVLGIVTAASVFAGTQSVASDYYGNINPNARMDSDRVSVTTPIDRWGDIENATFPLYVFYVNSAGTLSAWE